MTRAGKRVINLSLHILRIFKLRSDTREHILLRCCQCHVQNDLDARQKSRHCFASVSKQYISLKIVLISVCQESGYLNSIHFHFKLNALMTAI